MGQYINTKRQFKDRIAKMAIKNQQVMGHPILRIQTLVLFPGDVLT